ncbi:MAG TPA: hypothetical protein VLX56_00750 [Nitrososphaerales archaeon]|nr:hypothetical protein [Nitrososphaerales archaeon]
MADVRVRRSSLSRTSSILMMALGVFSWLFVQKTLGIALIALGVAMYFVHERLSKRPPPPES